MRRTPGSGTAIHHREIPQAIADGRADGGLHGPALPEFLTGEQGAAIYRAHGPAAAGKDGKDE